MRIEKQGRHAMFLVASFITHKTDTHGRRKRGDGGCVPGSEKLGGGCPPRFENEVARIRCLFRFLEYFGGRLTTLPTIRPPTQKSVATTLHTHRYVHTYLQTASGYLPDLPFARQPDSRLCCRIWLSCVCVIWEKDVMEQLRPIITINNYN